MPPPGTGRVPSIPTGEAQGPEAVAPESWWRGQLCPQGLAESLRVWRRQEAIIWPPLPCLA